MAALRSMIHLLLMSVTIMLCGLIMLVGQFFLKDHQLYAIGETWCKFVIYSLRWICGVKWRVHGRENLPQGCNTRIIVLCKHQSSWETLALNWLLGRNLVFVFKKELLKIPFFGWALGVVDMIYIDRDIRTQAMNKIIEEGNRFVDAGRWIIMFPEGTRVPRGQTQAYKSGGARVAIATHAHVLPIALSSAKCWPKNAWIKRPGTIDVVIGKPISSENKDHRELIEEVQSWIEGKMREIDASAYQQDNEGTVRASITE